MQATWIITANAGRARIFAEADPAQPLQEVEDMVNSAVRLRVTETESDKFGPTAAGKSSPSSSKYWLTLRASATGMSLPGRKRTWRWLP